MSNEYFSLILLLPLIIYPNKFRMNVITNILKSFIFYLTTKVWLSDRGQTSQNLKRHNSKVFMSILKLALIFIEKLLAFNEKKRIN